MYIQIKSYNFRTFSKLKKCTNIIIKDVVPMSLVRLVIKLNENRFLLRGGRRIMIHSRAVGISENPEGGE